MDKEMKQKKQYKNLSEIIEEHPKATFWTRFALWAILACGLPFAFIVYRFQLFHVISKVQIGGWGIIAILIVAIFLFVLLKYLKKALFAKKYSLTNQIVSGVCKVVLPLLTLFIILYNVRNNLDLFLQSLGCVILCETMAIPVNPMPKWVYEQQKDVLDNEKQDTIDYLLNGYFERKKANLENNGTTSADN